MRLSAVAMLSGLLSLATAGRAQAQAAPHLPHEARHGGAFGTAAADTVHVEAVWSEQRRLRLFLVGATGDPLTLDVLRNAEITAVADGNESPAALIEIDGHFEARVPTLALPATISARIRMSREAAAELLTFTFETYSRQLDDFARSSPAEIPDTLQGILRVIDEDRRSIVSIFADGTDAGRLLPIEERIRERAIALEPYLAALPADRLTAAQAAITRVVQSCWLLHIVMDFGDGAQLSESVTQLTEALAVLPAALRGHAP